MAGKILIVDDIPANLRLLSQILLDRGYEIRAAANGARALASIETDPPDLLLLDIRMPGMDGLEVLRELRERAPGTGVIMVTGVDDRDTGIAAIGLGACDYVTKPLDMQRLALAVSVRLALA